MIVKGLSSSWITDQLTRKTTQGCEMGCLINGLSYKFELNHTGRGVQLGLLSKPAALSRPYEVIWVSSDSPSKINWI